MAPGLVGGLLVGKLKCWVVTGLYWGLLSQPVGRTGGCTGAGGNLGGSFWLLVGLGGSQIVFGCPDGGRSHMVALTLVGGAVVVVVVAAAAAV